MEIRSRSLGHKAGGQIVKAIIQACLEIIETIKKILHDKKTGLLEGTDLNENIIEKYLYTEGLLDPDLLIPRLSNFLLWQVANTELWFSSKLWPDFTKKDLIEAIVEYNKRIKR
ncbi:MAG: hypothetical protein FH762_19720 [Firmicutes bacterium]|nr:hypothetical protein [Bacillota bacterium]